MDEIVIRYRVCPRDYALAVFLWFGGTRSLVLDLAAGIGSIAAGFVLSDLVGSALANWLIGLGIGLLVLLPIALFLAPFLQARRDPRFALDYETHFSDDGVVASSALNQSRLSWRMFTCAIVSERFCLLVYASRAFMTVPLAAFATEQDRSRFLSLVEARIGRVTRR